MHFRWKLNSPSGLETEGGGLQRINGTGLLGTENWSVDEGEVKTCCSSQWVPQGGKLSGYFASKDLAHENVEENEPEVAKETSHCLIEGGSMDLNIVRNSSWIIFDYSLMTRIYRWKVGWRLGKSFLESGSVLTLRRLLQKNIEDFPSFNDDWSVGQCRAAFMHRVAVCRRLMLSIPTWLSRHSVFDANSLHCVLGRLPRLPEVPTKTRATQPRRSRESRTGTTPAKPCREGRETKTT